MELDYIIYREFNKKRDNYYIDMKYELELIVEELIASFDANQLRKFSKIKRMNKRMMKKNDLDLINYAITYYEKLTCRY